LIKIAGSSRVCGKRPSLPAEFARMAACLAMAAQLAVSPLTSAGTAFGNRAASAPKAPDPILKEMQGELARATSSLAKTEPAPYYLSYTVNDQDLVVLIGSYGSFRPM
jgi:hypothetical protein